MFAFLQHGLEQPPETHCYYTKGPPLLPPPHRLIYAIIQNSQTTPPLFIRVFYHENQLCCQEFIMPEGILLAQARTLCPQRNNTTVVKAFLYLCTLHCLPPTGEIC